MDLLVSVMHKLGMMIHQTFAESKEAWDYYFLLWIVNIFKLKLYLYENVKWLHVSTFIFRCK